MNAVNETSEPYTSDDVIEQPAQAALALRQNRQEALGQLMQGASTAADITRLQEQHIATVLSEADVVKAAALEKIKRNREQRLSPNGDLLEAELSPAGLKILNDTIIEQNKAVSTALGMATKVTATRRDSSVSGGVTVSGTIIHAPAGAYIPKPLPEASGSGSEDEAIEGEVEVEDEWSQ